jgi:ribosomal protein S12 methylthiotransferase
MLRRMARRISRRETEELLAKLRARIPGLMLRTTLITGFPGETAEQFEELVDFVRIQRFQRLGVFTYSCEPDTPSANLPGHLAEEVKNERRERLMAEQQQIAFAWNQAQIGTRKDVILDRAVPRESNVWIGRSHADAPDIDAVVYVTGGKKRLAAGDIVHCEIVAVREYDLIGVVTGKPAKKPAARKTP